MKTRSDIAQVIGESEENTKKIMKLNDLIPELQTLVSEGKLGTTAAEQLAYLTESEQRSLFEALGEWKRETWQTANRKVFPYIWIVTDHQYNYRGRATSRVSIAECGGVSSADSVRCTYQIELCSKVQFFDHKS